MIDKSKLIEGAKLVHGDRYDYSLVDNVKNKKTKVSIICKHHGNFKQSFEHHINRKQGCPECSGTKKITSKGFIEKSKLIHGDRYDYSKVNYQNSNTNVKIICKTHGVFEQLPKLHLTGSNCPMCYGRNKIEDNIKKELEIIHNNRYDYSLFEYKNPRTKNKIICPEHGIFEQTLNTHKKGHGCPKCVGRNKTNDEFILKANSIHNNLYDYSLTTYINSNNKINIICKNHGLFTQTPASHLLGNGCPKCKGLKLREIKTKTLDEFITQAKLVHGNKYNYSHVNYENTKIPVKILCKKHGEFKQTPEIHLTGCGCQKCGLKYNKSEDTLKNFIKTLNIKIVENTQKIIPNFELDVYIPSHNIAIEFNGLYWHSELHKPSNYHITKTELCEKANIKLIHIFEDEWNEKREIVKSRIKNLLGLTEHKIYARKCEIKEVPSNQSKDFLDKNHIQGTTNSSIKIGLYYNNQLVSLMTFGKGRIAMGGNSNEYELVRFCNKINTNVIGGADRLLKYFIKTYKPNNIISYADRRWSQGNLYETLKFTKTHYSQPNYWYIIQGKRKHRFAYRKSILVKQGYDKNKSESEIMFERKIYRIYDCGTIVYKKTIA